MSQNYSRMDQVKFFKGCLLQILLVSFLNNLSHIIPLTRVIRETFTYSLSYYNPKTISVELVINYLQCVSPVEARYNLLVLASAASHCLV